MPIQYKQPKMVAFDEDYSKENACVSKRVCKNCRKAGHKLSECPEKDNDDNRLCEPPAEFWENGNKGWYE